MSLEFSTAIEACIKNGSRLLEDSKELHEYDRFPSAYALAKFAQEEFAKSFILHLVKEGALEWSEEVRKSLNHHVSKQLVGVILDYLNPDIEYFLDTTKGNPFIKNRRRTMDSINIYAHEILRRWKSNNWEWAEDPDYDKTAKKVFRGKEDRKKQNSIYVKILKDGTAINLPSKISRTDTEHEIEKAKRFGSYVGQMEKESDSAREKIVESFKIITKNNN
jgi:AbiV family abortive infection protein